MSSKLMCLMAAAVVPLASCGGPETPSSGADVKAAGGGSSPTALAARPVESHGKMVVSDAVLRLMTRYFSPSDKQRMVGLDGAALSPAEYVRDFAEIPGYHDAQAFQRQPKSDEMGPVARLYITAADYTDFTSWQMAATMDVDPFPTGSVAADYSAYSALGIEMREKTETYCVWLKGAPPDFQSILTRDNGTDCPRPETLPGTTQWLNVDAETITTAAADYLVTARFNDDRKDGPTIGVKCGATYWCEIGYERVKQRGPYKSKGISRQERLKPWHDEQRVSIKTGGGAFKRAQRATVVPAENLADLHLKPDFTASSGAVVATVRVSDPLAGKYDKWGLEDGDNTVRLYAQEKPTNSGRYIFWATMTSPSGVTSKPLKVDAAYHRTLPPGTARWVWNPNDEDIWIACDLGCCIVRGDYFNPSTAVAIEAPVRPTSNGTGSRGK